MQKLIAHYWITTPLFMGGLAGSESAEINVRGVKGAVRFWWRALNYAKLVGDTDSFGDLLAAEARLFGAAADERPGSRAGRSKCLWRVNAAPPAPIKLPNSERAPTPGLNYLAGMGLHHFREGFTRPCLWQDGGFPITIELVSQNAYLAHGTALTAVGQQLVDALHLFGLLGGLGARKSRGFGSVSMTKPGIQIDGISHALPPGDEQGYAVAIKALFQSHDVGTAESLPGFPAISARTHVEIVGRKGSADPVDSNVVARDEIGILEFVGRQMLRFRSYGAGMRDGTYQTSARETAEQNFDVDHDWAERPTDKSWTNYPHKGVKFHAERIAFGMPHNYTHSTSGNSKIRSVKPEGQERRGSPLLVHIHRLENGGLIAVVTILPARLVPKDRGLDIEIGRDRRTIPLMTGFETIDAWEILKGFLAKELVPQIHRSTRPYFPIRHQVWPP